MPLLKKLTLLSALLTAPLITSCSIYPKQLEVKKKPTKIERPIFTRPTPVAIPNKIKLVIITPEKTQSWNDDLKLKGGEPYVFFGYSEKDYLTFGQLLNDMLRFIKSQNAIIDAYEKSAIEHSQKQNPLSDK